MGGLFLRYQLLAFQGFDTVFEGFECAGVGHFDHPVDDLADFSFQLARLVGIGFRCLGQSGGLRVPCFGEHGLDHFEVGARRLERSENVLEFSMQLRCGDCLATLRTALMVAEVVGVLFVFPFAPSARQRIAAGGAGNSAPQREVFVDILTCGHVGAFFEALLDTPEGFLADDALMLRFAHGDTPTGHRDITAIENLFQHPAHRHLTNATIRQILREVGLGFQIANDFRLGGKASGCEPCERVPDDGGNWLVMHQHLAAALGRDVFEANRRDGANGIALFEPRHGLLLVLPSHLFALKLSGGSRDNLVKLALGRILEIEIEAFAHRTALAHDAAKLEMELDIPRIALEIVENHHETLGRARIHIGEQRHHAGAFHKIPAARYVIGKDGFNHVSLGLGILAAAVFLTIEAGTVLRLLLARYAAVDESFLWSIHLRFLPRSRRTRSRSNAQISR